jgi:hypothetical protein
MVLMPAEPLGSGAAAWARVVLKVYKPTHLHGRPEQPCLCQLCRLRKLAQGLLVTKQGMHGVTSLRTAVIGSRKQEGNIKCQLTISGLCIVAVCAATASSTQLSHPAGKLIPRAVCDAARKKPL